MPSSGKGLHRGNTGTSTARRSRTLTVHVHAQTTPSTLSAGPAMRCFQAVPGLTNSVVCLDHLLTQQRQHSQDSLGPALLLDAAKYLREDGGGGSTAATRGDSTSCQAQVRVLATERTTRAAVWNLRNSGPCSPCARDILWRSENRGVTLRSTILLMCFNRPFVRLPVTRLRFGTSSPDIDPHPVSGVDDDCGAGPASGVDGSVGCLDAALSGFLPAPNAASTPAAAAPSPLV